MARRTLLRSGLAALEMVSGRGMAFLYNVQIRITQIKWAVGIAVALALLALAAKVAQVSAEIARLYIERNGTTPPADIADELIAGTAGVPIGSVTDATLTGSPGVSLPYVQSH